MINRWQQKQVIVRTLVLAAVAAGGHFIAACTRTSVAPVSSELMEVDSESEVQQIDVMVGASCASVKVTGNIPVGICQVVLNALAEGDYSVPSWWGPDLAPFAVSPEVVDAMISPPSDRFFMGKSEDHMSSEHYRIEVITRDSPARGRSFEMCVHGDEVTMLTTTENGYG